MAPNSSESDVNKTHILHKLYDKWDAYCLGPSKPLQNGIEKPALALISKKNFSIRDFSEIGDLIQKDWNRIVLNYHV